MIKLKKIPEVLRKFEWLNVGNAKEEEWDKELDKKTKAFCSIFK